jgi:hypothetical protein
VEDWTTERGEDGAGDRFGMPVFKGTTLLMSTAQLLAVLEEGPVPAAIAAAPETVTIEPAPAPPAAPREVHRVPYAATAPAPPPRPGLLRRLRCGRRGHDSRPHRATPNDAVVYRCLRCGMQLPPPARH